MNKPCIGVAPGHVFNSSATLLSAMGHPIMTAKSKMAFNECYYGFVPHSGAIYYLNRLPRDFGTFMALTGLPIHGEDAKHLGLVDRIVHTSNEFELLLGDIMWSMEINQPSTATLYDEQMKHGMRYYNKMTENIMKRKTDFKNYNDIMHLQHMEEMHHENGHVWQSADAWNRVPPSQTYAENEYIRRLFNE